ncbi:F-box/LRR-repeat protein 21-like [Babylonia areolata]|uniref:F-box/LRR-repeat protein 21-like n=1 Tax=Babylonia areolata TaxID=304850 RepID=UPI003FD12290
MADNTTMMASAADVCDQETDTQYDFSCLPETVWVKVFEYLSLSDQYHVSTTCHNLYNVFNHPSNWKSAKLFAVGGDHNFSLTYSFLSDKFRIIVDKFGHFFQRLTVSFNGHLVRMQDDFREILIHMSQVCRLEHLVLEVGLMTSDFHLYGLRPQQEDVQSILMLVATAFRLKKIEILSWPMFPEIFNTAEVNVFEVMKKNAKLESLKSLSLFWMKNKQWSERMPLLPSPSYTFSLISHFRFLQHLAVRSPMLSDDLIQELASISRARLVTLKILVSYVAQDPKHSLPEISSSSWAALVRRSPRLAVEIAVMSRVPDVDMGAILRPEVPLTDFMILKYARCSEALVYSLREKFKNSLQSFICYHDPSDCDKELLRLVESCRNLHTLVFHGQIHHSRLMAIVKQRESWKHFEVIENNIMTESAGEEFDDDTVVGQGAGGDLVLVSLLRFHGQQTEEEREELMNALKAEVSKRIGYGWKPSSS